MCADRFAERLKKPSTEELPRLSVRIEPPDDLHYRSSAWTTTVCWPLPPRPRLDEHACRRMPSIVDAPIRRHGAPTCGPSICLTRQVLSSRSASDGEGQALQVLAVTAGTKRRETADIEVPWPGAFFRSALKEQTDLSGVVVASSPTITRVIKKAIAEVLQRGGLAALLRASFLRTHAPGPAWSRKRDDDCTFRNCRRGSSRSRSAISAPGDNGAIWFGHG